MFKNKRFISFLFLFLLTISACGGEEIVEESTTTAVVPTHTAIIQETAQATAPTAVSTPIAEPTLTALPTASLLPTPTPITVSHINLETGEITESVEPLPPFSLDELIFVDGEISGEALVLVLKLMIGEARPAELGLSTAISEGGTPVLMLAHEYQQSEASEPALQAEVSRLLNIVAPPLSQVQKYAQPASKESHNGRGSGLASIASQGVKCQDAWLLGLPSEGANTCFLFDQQSLLGHTYQVYYPTTWAEGDTAETEALYEAAMEAMLTSAVVYNQWGTIADATVIFSLLPYATGDGTGAMAVPWYQMSAGEACPILIYTDSFGVSPAAFKQMVAHELFHCYQVWNYPEVKLNSHTNKWWIEGSAEYFSNVVYPAVNYEHRTVSHFDVHSRNTSILDMSYENAVFFQYLANQMGGPTSVLALIDTLPISGGKAAQQQALANYGDMKSMLEGLGLAHLSSTGVADPGGSQLVVDHPSLSGDTLTFSDEQTEVLTSEPFVLWRQVLSYEAEKRFDQTVEMAENGSYTAVLVEDRYQLSAWSKLPEVVLGECAAPTKFVALVTTTSPSATELTVDVNKMEKADCDPCLLGTWEYDHDAFADFLSAALTQNAEGSGIAFVVDGVTGRLLLSFSEDRQMHLGSEDFQTNVSVPIVGTSVEVVVEASGSAKYTADGESLTASDFDATITSEESNAAGPVGIDLTGNTAVLSLPLNNLFGYGSALGGGVPQNFTPEPRAYICTEETLSYNIDTYGPVVWKRTEDIPPTPVPTPTN